MSYDVNNIFENFKNLKNLSIATSAVIIDCGHTCLNISNTNKISIGANGLVSDTEKATLELGVQLKHFLEEIGAKTVLINITLIDTIYPSNSDHNRALVKDIIAKGAVIDVISEPYKSILTPVASDVLFQLQSVNSNRFTNKIKYIKGMLRKDANYKYNLYEKTGVLCFYDNDVFSFSHLWLLNTENEDSLMNGKWWMDEHMHIRQSDLALAPYLRFKKNKIVGLYNRKLGINCSGSYCGYLLNFDKKCTHVAIYNRADDPNISEKILGGALSDLLVFDQRDKNYVQIILNPQSGLVEFSHLNIQLVQQEKRVKCDEFEKMLKDNVSSFQKI